MSIRYRVSRPWSALFAGALALLTACHPDLPQPVAGNLVYEKDTTYFKLLWQKPTSAMHLVNTPNGIVVLQRNLNPDSPMVCRRHSDGAIIWTGGSSKVGNSSLLYVNGYVIASEYSSVIGTGAAISLDAKTGKQAWMYENDADWPRYASKLSTDGTFVYQAVVSEQDTVAYTVLIRRTSPAQLKWDTLSVHVQPNVWSFINYISEPVCIPTGGGSDTLVSYSLMRYTYKIGPFTYFDAGGSSLHTRSHLWYASKVDSSLVYRYGPPVYDGKRMLLCSPPRINLLDMATGSLKSSYTIGNPNDNLLTALFLPGNQYYPLFCLTHNGTLYSDELSADMVRMDYRAEIEHAHQISGGATYRSRRVPPLDDGSHLVFLAADPGEIIAYDLMDYRAHRLTSPNTPRYPGTRIVSDPVIRNDTLFCSDGYYLMCYKLKL